MSISRQLLNNCKFHSILLESCNSIQKLNQIHARLIITSQINNTFLATKLLESWAISAKNIAHAHLIFDHIRNPSSYSWTTMIRGYCNTKNPEKALQFYRQMRRNDVEMNRYTFIFVLKACAMIPSFIDGKVVHGKIWKMGFDCDVFVNNGLVHFYSKCDDIDSACKVFDEMPSWNVVNWNTLIGACFRCGDLKNGFRLFNEMPKKDIETWNVVISGFCKVGQIEIARALFDAMEERDSVSWGSMISGYVQNGMAKSALELFKRRQVFGVKFDSVIVTSVLSACAQMDALDVGKWIHEYMKRNNVKNDVHLGTALVDMYAKCGCIDRAMKLFNDTSYKNTCTWNAMLSGLSFHGHGFEALELFRQMELSGVVPNDVTFVAVLSACSHVGLIDEGWRQFDRLQREFNIVPKIEHYGCMVDLLGRGGFIDEVKELIKGMPMEPNIVIWGVLLNACKIHGYGDIDDGVLANLQNLGCEDGGSYVLLSNIFASKHEWRVVESLRRMIKETGSVRKVPGCSSIEVNSVVHEFFVDDKTHPEWVQISEVIEGLRCHLIEDCTLKPSIMSDCIDKG